MKLPADTGLVALVKELKLQIQLPATRSKIVSGSRRTEIEKDTIREFYPKSYASDSLYGHLKFALRYEPVDLSVYQAVFKKLDAAWLETHIGSEPIGIYARRI